MKKKRGYLSIKTKLDTLLKANIKIKKLKNK
jgi:hypothetical protein